jgi:uncharacterized cupin superfamily protein
MSLENIVFFDQDEPEFDEYETAPEKCVRGRPLQRTWHHFTSSDEKFLAGLWEAEPGCWNIRYTENEFCQIVAGRSVLRDDEGRERIVGSGDSFVIPAGFSGQWEVLETTKKIYVIYQP